MPTRTGIRISALQEDLDELTRVDISSDSTTATISTEGTKDLILNTNEGTNSGTITIEDGTSGDIKLATQNEVHLTGGSVGIGTTSPGSHPDEKNDLVIGDASGHHGMTVASGAGSIGTLRFAHSTTANNGEGWIDYHNTSKNMRFGTDGLNTRMTIDSSGNVTFAGEVIANAGIDVKNGDTGAGYVNFYEDSDNGTNSVTVIGPASTADVTLTLPSATDTLVGKATTDTLTNKTLTAPKIADDGYIADANGNEQLVFVQTASAVNHWEMTNATSGSPLVTLQAAGDTADVSAVVKPKGEGVVAFIMTHANSAVSIKGVSSGDAVLEFQPDNGTAADQWTVSALDDGHFAIASKISGSLVEMLEITPNATAANSSSALAGSLSTTGKISSAGQVVAYRAETSNYETDVTDHVIVASRGITVTLKENAPAGTVFVIKRVDDGTSDGAITVSRKTSDTIDGANTKSLADNYDSITVVSDGSNYHMIAETLNEEEGGGGGGGP